MDGVENSPLPGCLALGLILFSVGLISGACIRCRVLLPECPVTSVVRLAPIGTCRISYAYDVLSDHYVGSLDLRDRSCPEADGVNHTVAVCYDDRDPSVHVASIYADSLSPSGYTGARVFMWIGAAMVGLAAGQIIALFVHGASTDAPPVPIPAGPPQPQPQGPLESRPPKLHRSDSAMIEVM